MRQIKINSDPLLKVKLTEDHIEHFEDEADKRGISRAALIRLWLAAGERAEHNVIPELEDTSSQTGQPHTDPVKQLFYKHLPSDPDEAATLDEVKSQMKDEVERRTIELFRQVEDIEMVDGNIYHAQR